MTLTTHIAKVAKRFSKSEYAKYYAIPTALPTTTYRTEYLDPFINGTWDLGKLTPIIVSVYGDTFGANGAAIVQGSWLVTLLAMYWLRHEDVMVPFMMMVILTNVVFWTPGLIPEDWKWFLVGACILLPVGAIIYSLISDR